MRKNTLLLISLFLIFSLNPLCAESDAELIAIAGKIASDTATPKEQAIAFKCNNEINNLAMDGKISKDVYRKNQKKFDSINSELAANAAAKNGLDTSGKTKDSYKAGTDSDIQLSSKDKKLTSDDVAKTRNDYNKEVDNYLKKNGVETKGNENWAKKTETDIMPSPDQMTPDEFKKSAEYINKDGGNMYKNKGAADTQLKIDSKKGVSLDEGPAYANELQGKVRTMKNEKAKLERELKNTNDPERKAHLETEIKKCESHEAKYIERIDKLNEATKEQYKIKSPEQIPSSGDKALKDAQSRDFARGPDGKMSSSEKGAHVTDAMDKHMTNKALENYNNTIAEIGKNPQYTKKSQAIIAENIKSLPPAQQGEAISNLENKFGKDFAKGVTENVRTSGKTPVSPSTPSEHPGAGAKEPQSKATPAAEETAHGNLKKQKTGASIAAALGFITAGLNSYNEELETAKRENRKPDYGKMLGNTVYNATVGGYINAAENTLKAVTADTLEYRKKLEDDYKKSGADMGAFSTQFKIWAQSTIYGSGLGIWQGVHAVPLVGDVLGAGETVIAVTGESLATMDELNAQSANIQNQEMSQRLTDAQSIRKAEKLLNSMELMIEQSKTLTAELNKNCEWVRDTSGKYISWKSSVEDKLKDYQNILNSTAEMKDKNQKAGIFGQDYTAGVIRDFASIKIQSAYHAKRAGELMKQHEESPVKPEERKPIEDIIAEHKLNNERFENRLAEMKILSDISQNGDMAKYVQKLKNNIKNEFEAAQSIADNSLTASKNIDSLVKQISETSKNLSQMKLSLKKASAYFSRKDEKLKAAWADVESRAASIKDIDFNAGDYKREQDFIRRFPDSVNNYIKAVKIPEAGDLSWLDAEVKNSEKVLASLRKPAEETAVELDKAAGKMMFLAGLLNLKSCIVNVAVLDEATGKPIAAAKVSLSGNGFNSAETTNANGAGFSDVPEGNLSIDASADGYSSASVKINVVHSSSLEYREVLKLKRQSDTSVNTVQPSGDAVTEAVKVAKDDEKKYASVSAEELKKARPMIDAAYYALEKGNLINHNSMILRAHDISGCVKTYIGANFSADHIRLMLLDKSNGRNDMIFQKLCRVAAAKAIEEACSNNYYNRLVLMKNGFEAARMANAPLDPLIDTAKAFVDFRMKQRFATTVNLSDLKYWKAYAAFYDPKTKKSNKDKPNEIKAEDAEKWVELICKGGYDAVAKELDKFWTDKAEAKEKSKFLQENPNAAEDYQNAYISNSILPALALWSKNMKDIKEKEFTATIAPLLQPLLQTGIVFSGSVKCFPESAPWKVIVREDTGHNKVIAEKTMTGDGEYSFSFKLSELPEPYIGVRVEPVMEKINELNRSGGDWYSFRPSSAESASPGTKVSIEGSTIKVVFTQALVTSRMRPKNISYDAPEVPVPSMPANKIQAYQALIMAPYNSFKAGEISLEEASKRNEHMESEFYMAKCEFEDKYNAVYEAITHNIDVRRKELVRQKKNSEADELQKEINKTNEGRYKELDKIRASWNFGGDGRKALNAARNELSKKREELYAKKKQRDDKQSALRKEYSEALNEFQNALNDWSYVPVNIQGQRVNRIGSSTANADILDEYMDKELLKAKDKLKNNLNAGAEKIAAVSVKAAAWMENYGQLNKEINQYVRERCGLWKGIDYEDSSLSDNVIHFSGMSGSSWYYDIREIAWVSDAIGKSEMKNFFDKNVTRTDAYFKKKGGYSQDLDSILAEAKKNLEKLSPETAAALAADLKVLLDDIHGYAFFFENAVLLSDPSAFKTDAKFSDASGSDVTFITDARKKLDALTATYKDYLSDKLLPPERMPGALGRFEELIYELRLSAGDMTEEQRKKFYEMQDKYNKICTAAVIPYDLGNIKLVIDEASKTGGKTPAERIKKIIQINSEAVNYMKKLSVPSVPGEVEKFLSDADRWFGKMRGPPTLDALKARGELYSKLYKTGVLNAYRKAHNMPPGPESFIMNGKPCPYDGSTIVLRYSQLQPISARTAEAYAKSGIKNITHALFTGFKKNNDYRMERASYNLNNFYDAGDGSYTVEDPMGTEWLPRIVKVCFRQCDKNSNSKIPNEPPVTIIVLP